MSRRILPYGERAILVEVDSLAEALRLHRGLEAEARPGVVELVPAARTVAVLLDPAVLSPSAAAAWALAVPGRDAPAGDAGEVRIPVVYDGPDLGDVARVLAVDPREVVARHTAARWRVAFTGFAPGFGYLVADGDDGNDGNDGDAGPGGAGLETPRLGTPRTSVPAGAVALAGGFSAVYPRRGPGGWRLIGSTTSVLWDPSAEEPTPIVPGRRVRFVEVR